ncbi:TPA: bifunctional methylenetetrahydrofolate dehydrogenase/methenyltetrahydrofolate cyclohydrolase FolD [Candidatus Woesearchaeota archaeon]|nr:bifunctional methylenetetrahydrofolate dehydrogenase/methenyltetrahydrofolate cyclohydrolase FolD [Candidatus Woesearchaeota archaeon]
MPAKIIDGKAIAQKIRENIKQQVAPMKTKPGLAVVRVGNDPASIVYVNSKEKACQDAGFYSEKYELKEDIQEKDLLKQISKLNKDKKLHGILVQLPLPAHISQQKVLEAISPEKDVDGFNPVNFGRLLSGNKYLYPATPKGVVRLLDEIGCKIAGKHVVVIGRSNIVGKPVAVLLLERDATVTICHSKTKDLIEECRKADILISAVGKKGLVSKEMVKQGAVVIDVGITRENGKLFGDVDFDDVKKVASWITPVPGGVGPMTIAMLLENTLVAKRKIEESK